MADPEAIAALRSGAPQWDAYCLRAQNGIDLSFADLQDADLSGRVMHQCDLTGVQFEAANLDRAIISECQLNGTNLSNASLVGSHIRNSKARAVIADGLMFRKGVLSNVDIDELSISEANFDDVAIDRCRLSHIRGKNLRLVRCRATDLIVAQVTLDLFRVEDSRFTQSEFSDWDIGLLEWDRTDFDLGVLCRWAVAAGSFRSSRLIRSRVRDIHYPGALMSSQDLDVSGSTLSGLNLEIIGLSSATMLETSLIDCAWPQQRGTISWSGVYTQSADLLNQPVQDVRGVSPLMRRIIADNQYIARLLQQENKKKRAMLRLWGACTGFGQSLGRLSLATFILWIIATLNVLAVRGQLHSGALNFDFLSAASRTSFEALFALTDLPSAREPLETAVIEVTRIIGFLVLGFWVTIASNKLSKLGAE